jgi:glycosyltransferase involved in cell wall biosynthesis
MTTSIAFAMGSKPAISVLMAVYNSPEDYLGAAVASILQQSYRNFEFIIVDDGSDSATGDRLRMWADHDHRIRLHKLPANVGLTKALNAGLRIARGSYLARQDADDVSEPYRLEAQLEFLAVHPEIDAVGTNATLIDVGSNKIGEMEIDPELKGLAQRNLLVHGSMLFRRHVFDVLGGYDERMRLSQDYEIYLRMTRVHGMRIGVLQKAHYRLRQHPASLSSRSIFRQLYYSVMAKSLTEHRKGQFWREVGICRNLIVDFLFTHRLFLGTFVRKLTSDGIRAHRTGSKEAKSFPTLDTVSADSARPRFDHSNLGLQPFSMAIRVFHFILDHRVGGPHVYVRCLANSLVSEVKSTLVTAGRGPLTDIALLNFRHIIRWLYPLEVISNAIWLCWRFRRRRSRQRVVFDVHGAANLAPIVAARIMNIPMVWHFHETAGGLLTLVALGKMLVAGIPHRMVVVAKKAAAVFSLPGATLIPGAVDTHYWSLAKSVPRSFDGVRRLRILSVGNLNPLKGADVLLTALETLEQPWELVIAGAELQTYSDYAQDLRKHADRLESPTRRARFAGWRSAAEIRSLMEDSDVFVLPSRSEACPIALLEAMAAGCVCIATDVGDVREIMEDSSCGIVVPSESASALAAAIEHVAELGTAERQRMGKLAQKAIAARFSLQTQAEKHLGIYNRLASMSEGAV